MQGLDTAEANSSLLVGECRERLLQTIKVDLCRRAHELLGTIRLETQQASLDNSTHTITSTHHAAIAPRRVKDNR